MISVPDDSSATEITAALETTLGTAEKASATLGVTVESEIAVSTVALEQETGEGGGDSVGGVVGGVVGGLAAVVAAVAAFFLCRRKGAAKSAGAGAATAVTAVEIHSVSSAVPASVAADTKTDMKMESV